MKAERHPWLEAARRDLSPSPERVASLRGRLRASIEAGAAPSFEGADLDGAAAREAAEETAPRAAGSDEAATREAAVRAGLSRGSVGRSLASSGSPWGVVARAFGKWIGVGVGGAVVFAAGYGVGWRHGAEQRPAAGDESSMAPEATGDAAERRTPEEPLHEDANRERASSHPGLDASEPGGSAATSQPVISPAPRARVAPGDVSPRRLEPPEPPVSSEPARSAASAKMTRLPGPTRASSDLGGEIALLQKAQQALRGGRPERARQWLAELDQRHPGGALGEERAAVAVLATCQLESNGAAAQRAGSAFLQRYPGSAYAERVTAVCSLDDGPTP